MANEKRLEEATAECFEEVNKIKTNFAKIIVEGTVENPYYSILYYDPKRKEYFNGYGSYNIANVFGWLNECFEIDETITVDAVEVVYGRWIEKVDMVESYLADCTEVFYECSVCEAGNIGESPYCPNCGAKMDGDWNG